ncbi:MAG: type II secretion system protein [Verrucomicrobia bacterium]|nr:type II secretion system protein [Verrucomicrobiota bacterium]
MKLTRGHHEVTGWNLIQLIVVVAVIVVLAIVILPTLSKARERAQRISCTGRLKGINLSFLQWALDHTNAYPMTVSTNDGGTLEHAVTGEVWRHFQVMSNELSTPLTLVCPSDRDRSPARDFRSLLSNTNISYFVGLDADKAHPQMLLAGDRNLLGGTLLPNGILLLTSNDTVSWSGTMHKHQGNVALADGSVQGFSSGRLREALLNTGVATNRLAFP